MRLHLVGTSFRTAAVEVRERLAVSRGELAGVLEALTARDGVREALLVSTCNRVELLYVEDGADNDAIVAWLLQRAGISMSRADDVLFQHTDEAAIRHLFRVAGSLDSMILGESQITGQVKEAYRQAVEAGTVGPLLHRLMRKTFSVAKRVRTETKVGAATLSVANAAVEMATRIFEDLAKHSILMLGAGEMGELALKGFAVRGAKDLWVSNRTLETAAEVAAPLGAGVLPWERRVDFLRRADIVVCSTGANEPVLYKGDLAPLRRARRGRPLFLVDISVPRNLDPALQELPWVYMFDIDDLSQVVDANAEARAREAEKAEAIVAGEVAAFGRVLSQVHVAPLIRAMNRKIADEVQREVDRTLKGLGSVLDALPDEQRGRIEAAVTRMAQTLGKRVLHHPIGRIKTLGREGELDGLEEVARVFGVEALLLEVRDGDAGPPTSDEGAESA